LSIEWEFSANPHAVEKMFLSTPKAYATIECRYFRKTVFWSVCMPIGDLDEAVSDCVEAALAASGYNPPYNQNGAVARPESG
jgi:hypothetical protein